MRRYTDAMQKLLQRGFTIVELMIVIVIIAILASISLVMYKNTQNQARAASLSTALQKVQTNMIEMTTRLHSENWPMATDFIGTSEPNLTTILAPEYVPGGGQTTLSTLRDIMPSGVPSVSGVDGLTWTYRNSGGTHSVTGCDGKSDGRRGPLLEIKGVSTEVMNQLDKDIDDHADDCGKVRIYNNALIYQLDFTQRVE